MPRPLVSLALAPLLAGCASSAPAAHDPWTRDLPDVGGSAAGVMAVAPSGEIALAGGFTGQLNLGNGVLMGTGTSPGENDVFIGLLDQNGRPEWSSATGSSSNQTAVAVAFTPDGSVIAMGGFTNSVNFGTGVITAVSEDIFLVALGHDGKAAWVRDFGSDLGGPSGAGSANPLALAVDASGNIALGGSFTGTIGFGGPPLDAPAQATQTSFVAKLDGSGKHLYSLAFGGLAHQVNAVAFDAAGDLYVAGTNFESVIIGGTTFNTFAGSGFVAKLDPRGNPLWAFQLGGGGTSQAQALAVDASGDVLVGGVFTGDLSAGTLQEQATTSLDGLVLEVTSSGTPRWLKTLGGAAVSSVAFGNAGAALVTGVYEGAPDFGGGALPPLDMYGAFATKLDASGAHVRSLGFGLQGNPSVGAGIGSAGSDVVVTGDYSGMLVIGGKTLTAVGTGTDIFLSRLSL